MGLVVSFRPGPLYSMTVTTVQKGKRVSWVQSRSGFFGEERNIFQMPESTPIPWSPNPYASHSTNRAYVYWTVHHLDN